MVGLFSRIDRLHRNGSLDQIILGGLTVRLAVESVGKDDESNLHSQIYNAVLPDWIRSVISSETAAITDSMGLDGRLETYQLPREGCC